MPIQNMNGPGSVSAQKNTIGALNKTNRALKKILNSLSTAQRINRASDDAAGLSISEQLRTQSRGFKMATRNVTDAISAMNIAEGSSQEIGNILQRQRELAIQARNDTLNDDQRQALDTEYQQLQQEVDRIAESTEFNTQDVANGEGLGDGEAQIQAGPNAGDTIELPEFDITTSTLGLGGASVATSSAAADALSRVDNAISELNNQRSSTGAMINRFESAQNNLAVAEINTQAAESVIRDQDIAAGIADLTRQRLLQEGGTSAFARFNQINADNIMKLIR